jgi:AcrR family transcriptional regulator
MAAGADSGPAETKRPRLSKAAVVRRAIALADARGLDALTIRRLARELGVTPMALYWHFRTKGELLDALASQIWSEIDTHVETGAPWPAQLRALLESLVHVLRAHPSASQLLMAGDKQDPGVLAAAEATLEVLRRAGLRCSARQRSNPQCPLDRAHARGERARLLSLADRGRAGRAPAAQHGPAGHAAAGPLPPRGRCGCPDDRPRRPGLPLPGRHRPVRPRRPGNG